MARYRQINFLILLFFSKFLIGQNIIDSKINETNPPTFNLNRDKHLYEKLKEWKDYESLYDTVEISYDLLDSANIVAKNPFFTRQYEIYSTGSKDKSKVTGIAQFLTSGELEKWFEPTLSSYFESFGSPKEKLINKEVTLNEVLYFFEKAYVWERLFYDTPTKVYGGYANRKEILKNKKGKIKRENLLRYGVTYLLPFKKSISPVELEQSEFFNEIMRVSYGFLKSYKEDISLKIKLNEKYQSDFVEDLDNIELYSSFLFSLSDKDDPNEYLKSFVVMSSSMYNMFINQGKENITLTTLEKGTIAAANGMNNNCSIDLYIDIEQWNKSSYLERCHIIFHELGHDYFNLKHSDGIRLMATNKFNIENPEDLGDMIQEMFSYVVRNKSEEEINCIKQ